MIRTFFSLERVPAGATTLNCVRALRNAAVIVVAILAIASAAALAVASGGGSARGDAGQGQYGAKPDCRPQRVEVLAGLPPGVQQPHHRP